MKYVSKEDILKQVYITDIASEFHIELHPAFSGNFDYRCVCPSQEHKNGNERTGSLYIDSEENNFYCFGCQAGNNPIDFFMLCSGKEFRDSFEELKKRAKPSGKTSTFQKKKNNLPILIDVSHMLRKAMLENPRDLKWINKVMEQTDQHIIKIGPNNIEKAKSLKTKLEKLLKERYNQ